MRTSVCILAAAIALAAGVTGVRAAETAGEPPRIQIAILLDTSNSMDGLIEQAKTELWRIVNEFATAKREGKRPELQVALYEYGKSSLPQGEGYLRMILPLTTDLDKVSEELFALKTNGGDEYCGKVIQAATEGLDWSRAGQDYKAIFIAGNEPFTQGDVDYGKACKGAIAKGIIVNTIFCGHEAEGVNTKWKDGATLADGSFMSIDQNTKAVAIAAPQDAEIARLGAELTGTYIPYGAEGTLGLARQAAQESNAMAASPSANVQRQVAKSSSYYRNERWDLVDATREGKVKLGDLKEADLPEAMRKMNEKQREAYVTSQTKKRADLQARISKLDQQRRQYVAEQMKKQSTSAEKTFDKAVIETVRSQAAKRNFQFE